MGRSDADLLEASRRGEREAFGALIERYQGVVCAVTYSRTGDRALSEDVAQDTFIAAWRQLDRLREPGRLRAWLCGIARNLARKARRRSDREAPLDEPLPFEGGNPFDHAAEAESERVVRDALSRVPETYRDVLVLYYREQRSVRDVAAALGLSEAAALQRLARGRQYLARGVNDLVERSLRAARVQKSLVGAVLAALPALAPSRAEAATSAHGGTMWKIACTTAALLAAGTIYVARSSPSSSSTTGQVAAAAAVVTPSAAPSAPARVATPAASPPHLPAPSANGDPAVDERPVLDRATIERLGLNRGPGRGPANAPVTIVVFTDLQCPFCSASVGTLDQLWDEYPGKLRLIVKQLVVHPSAALAAEAVLAADAQGKFWDLYDLTMAHQEAAEQTRDGLVAMARQAGLDVDVFRAALDAHTYAAAVKSDFDTAKELHVNATPTFLINGKQVTGSLPINTMRAAIDQALADAP